jgi:hypothetical protein
MVQRKLGNGRCHKVCKDQQAFQVLMEKMAAKEKLFLTHQQLPDLLVRKVRKARREIKVNQGFPVLAVRKGQLVQKEKLEQLVHKVQLDHQAVEVEQPGHRDRLVQKVTLVQLVPLERKDQLV